MRFLHTTTLKFHELFDSEISGLENGYAILSHRWGAEEILYPDILNLNADVNAKCGCAKISGACKLDRDSGYEFIWIDTCCIDKTNSVELGEAINSMYRWYAMAAVCIAHLSDITSSTNISESVWFDRGWTLQELIAPKSVLFHSRDWQYLRDRDSLGTLISDKTGIPIEVLQHIKRPQDYSIAQRMSWAAKRSTTRFEDRAYCLFGLFDVNMPMIYGEREGAFTRLQ
ncbi:hypothetical protein MMC25_002729 [Agyrium rufum]|nr:hypothetical protein [Agyrium rufum]